MYSNHLNAIIFILLFSHIKKAQIAVGSSQKKLHSSLKCESRTHINRLVVDYMMLGEELHHWPGYLKKNLQTFVTHLRIKWYIYKKNIVMIGAIYSILTLKLTLKYYIYVKLG